MEFVFGPDDIDHGSSISIRKQIAIKVALAVIAGDLQADDKVASARELSEYLKINPNTVAYAYRLLESCSILVIRKGKGVFVSDKSLGECLKHQALEWGEWEN